MPIISLIPAKSTTVVAAGSQSILIRKGILIEKDNWTKDDEVGYYTYKIIDGDVTENSSVEIHVYMEHLIIIREADVQSSTDSYNGYVIMYSKNLPTADFICDYVIQKEATHTRVLYDGSDLSAKDIEFYSEDKELVSNNVSDAIHEVKNISDSKINSLSEKIGSSDTAISSINTEISSLKNTDTSLANSVNGLQNQVTSNGNKITNNTSSINAINTALNNLPNAYQKKSTTLSSTLSAGQTSLSFTNSSIDNTKIIDIYTSVFGINPTNAIVSGNTISLSFDAQSMDISVLVVIN